MRVTLCSVRREQERAVMKVLGITQELATCAVRVVARSDSSHTRTFS
jgi:hypothetical protein